MITFIVHYTHFPELHFKCLGSLGCQRSPPVMDQDWRLIQLKL